MFVEWTFLLAEIWVLLLLAALLGLLAGWIIWGGQPEESLAVEEAQRLRLALEKERARARAMRKDGPDDVMAGVGGSYLRPGIARAATMPNATSEGPSSRPAPDAPPASAPVPDSVADPAPPALATAPGDRPPGLSAPVDGLPDDLTKIKGIGAKMERLCNDLGFYHYDQIAAWSDREVAWVDDNLEGFKGRVSRDNWVESFT